jgi:hypothetical protein
MILKGICLWASEIFTTVQWLLTLFTQNWRQGFLKSKSGVVVPGQPGPLILLAHQKYWLPITNRSLMNSSSKSFGVYFVVSCSEIYHCPVDNRRVAGTFLPTGICPRPLDNFRNPDHVLTWGYRRPYVDWLLLQKLLVPVVMKLWRCKSLFSRWLPGGHIWSPIRPKFGRNLDKQSSLCFQFWPPRWWPSQVTWPGGTAVPSFRSIALEMIQPLVQEQ